MQTIDSLLSHRHAKRHGRQGSAEAAQARAEHSRFLAENFSSFDAIRGHLLHPENHSIVENPALADVATKYLMSLGWIRREGESQYCLDKQGDVREYLGGGWLEELVFLAHLEAGCDEAYFGQEIEWRIGSVVGKNEIDVLARRGDVLSFTSCKTVRPLRLDKMGENNAQLRGFLTETDYWNIHFADDRGRALLVVSADFVDERASDADRYPVLNARASVLDVSIVGLEDIVWNRLVTRIEQHW